MYFQEIHFINDQSPRSLLFDLEKGTGPVLDILKSRKASRAAEYIRVEYWGDGNILVSEQELIEIFGLIGNLPNVKELRIEFDELPLPAKALKNALSHQPSHLRYLALEDVRLSGDSRDFEDVAMAMKETTSLRSFRMNRCGPHEGTLASLDPIVAALASVPNLKDIVLSSTHLSSEVLGILGQSTSLETVSLDHMTISPRPLSQLCQSRTIRELKFWGMPEINDDITFMTISLSSNKSLKAFRSRYCHLNEEAGLKISEMLRTNDTLESITLENMNWPDFGFPMALCLKENKSLTSLSLAIDSRVTNLDQNAAMLIGALESNSSLKRLRIMLRAVTAERLRDAFVAPITRMLQKNYILESIFLNGNLVDLGAEVSFFLKLNGTKHRHLLRDERATKEEFVSMLAKHTEDQQLSHYILSMNPSLFC